MHSNGRQRISTEVFGPGSEFGFSFPLRFFDLLTTNSQTMPIQVRHGFGFGYNAAGLPKNSLPFFRLLTQFGALPPTHNRQVESSNLSANARLGPPFFL